MKCIKISSERKIKIPARRYDLHERPNISLFLNEIPRYVINNTILTLPPLICNLSPLTRWSMIYFLLATLSRVSLALEFELNMAQNEWLQRERVKRQHFMAIIYCLLVITLSNLKWLWLLRRGYNIIVSCFPWTHFTGL